MKKVSAGTLPNGMRVYSHYDKYEHVSGIGVNCGSIHDPLDSTGLAKLSGMAHLAEHMKFRQSPKYSLNEVELIYEKYLSGPEGDINVRVTRSNTFFGHDQLLRRNHAMIVFDMMVDLVRNTFFDQFGLDVEQAAILQEYYLRGMDWPESLIHDLIHKAMYKKNPARNRIDCEIDQLKKITNGRLRHFVKKHYVPSNMFVVFLGPKFQEVMDLANRYFGDLPAGKIPKSDYNGSENFPRLTETNGIEVEKPGINQFHFALGFPTEPSGGQDDAAIEILRRIWAFRVRNRLREQNREFGKGTYRALAYTSKSAIHGLIYIWFATTSEEFLKKAQCMIIEECEKLKSTLVSEEEIDAVRSNLYYNYLQTFSVLPGVLSEMIIESASNGDEEMRELNGYGKNILSVSRRKILVVANKYMTPNYNYALIKPV